MATPSGAHALASITSGKISPASLLAPSTVISGVRSPRSDVLVLELENTVFRSPALVKPVEKRHPAASTPARRRSNRRPRQLGGQGRNVIRTLAEHSRRRGRCRSGRARGRQREAATG